MATILTKKSDTASAVPLAADLTNAAGGAELAVNATDKRLFSKTSGGTVVELGINPSSLTMPNGTANGVAYLNGSKVVTSGSALTFDGTNFATTGSGTFSGLLNRIHAQGTDAYITNTTTGKANTVMGFNDSGSTNGQGIPTGYSYYGSLQTYPIGFTSSGYLTNSISSTNHIWNITGSEQMRLTSTGLGIGTSSPSQKLHVVGNALVTPSGGWTTGGVATQYFGDIYGSIKYDYNTTNFLISSYGTFSIATNGTSPTTRLIVDGSGNLGLGVTPSAWGGGSGNRAIEVGFAGSGLWSNSANNTVVTSNAYFNGSGWRYGATGTATISQQDAGAHKWYNAPSGTAGNAITFTQAMSLTAGGDLLVGKTSASATSGDGFWFSPDGQGYVTSSYTTNAALTWRVYSTGAAAYRFYVGYGGTVYATSTTITAISDQRLKENIRDLDDGLDVVMALKPRKFDWKTGKGKDIKNDRGFIAQELEKVLPDMVENWADPAPEGEEAYKAVNANLIPTLVKAIQEQQAIIESLKARLDAANL